MRILAIINGDYGARHVANIQKHKPNSWQLSTWEAPTTFPIVIDYPEDYLPEEIPSADLILSFAEHRGVAELLPEIVEMSHAKALIAAIDNESWLPRGLARQLRGWLQDMNIPCATPKPLCSLTEHDYLITRQKRISFSSPYITEFAKFFGQPKIELVIDPESRRVREVKIIRDAVCGCTRYVAQGLVGTLADEVEEKGGLLHHHYPCLASMGIDVDFNDTLMHVSGNLLKDNLLEQVKPHKTTRYIIPPNRSQDE
jgi:thymidylate synthase